jgi:hypothetical protein
LCYRKVRHGPAARWTFWQADQVTKEGITWDIILRGRRGDVAAVHHRHGGVPGRGVPGPEHQRRNLTPPASSLLARATEVMRRAAPAGQPSPDRSLAQQPGGGRVGGAEAGAEHVAGDWLPVLVPVLGGGPARHLDGDLVMLNPRPRIRSRSPSISALNPLAPGPGALGANTALAWLTVATPFKSRFTVTRARSLAVSRLH